MLKCVENRNFSLNIDFFKIIIENDKIEFVVCYNDFDIEICLTFNSNNEFDYTFEYFRFVFSNKSKHHVNVITFDKYENTIIFNRCKKKIFDDNVDFDRKFCKLSNKNFKYFDLLTIEHAKFAKCIWHKIFDFFHIDNFIEICNDVTIFRMNQTTMSNFQIDNWFNKRENVRFWHEYRKNNNFRDNEYCIDRILNDTQYEKIVD